MFIAYPNNMPRAEGSRRDGIARTLKTRLGAPSSFWSAALVTSLSVALDVGAAVVRYVDPSSPSANPTGDAWTTAYHSLQAALDDPFLSIGSTIHVAEGTYVPTVAYANQPQASTFLIDRFLILYGGYPTGGGAAGPADPAHRRPSEFIARLSGDLPPGAETDRALHVVVFRTVDTFTKLDGFLVEHGRADGLGLTGAEGYEFPSDAGGGILCYGKSSEGDASPVIQNCVVRDCRAFGQGGGIMAHGKALPEDEGDASPSLRATFVAENVAWSVSGEQAVVQGNGGGIGAVGGVPELVSCLVTLNSSGQDGGALYASTNAAFHVYNCTIADNWTDPPPPPYFMDHWTGGVWTEDDLTVDPPSPLQTWIINTILWGNDNDDGIAQLSDQINTLYGSALLNDRIYSSCVQDLPLPATNGNFGDDPLFVGPGDYRIPAESSCRDAGSFDPVVGPDNDNARADDYDIDNDLDTTEYAPDIRRWPRVYPNLAAAGLIDVGAYEYMCVRQDLDGDLVVGAADLSILLGEWSGIDPCWICLADFDDSGTVNSIDLGVLLGAWQDECAASFAMSASSTSAESEGSYPESVANMLGFASLADFTTWLGELPAWSRNAILQQYFPLPEGGES